MCGGGLAVTTRDQARFGLVLAEGGRIGDDQVVPVDVIQSIRAGGDPGVFQRGGKYGYLAASTFRVVPPTAVTKAISFDPHELFFLGDRQPAKRRKLRPVSEPPPR